MSSSVLTACLVLWAQTSSTSYFTLFLVDIPCMVLASPVSWLSWLLGCSRGCTLTIGLFRDTDPITEWQTSAILHKPTNYLSCLQYHYQVYGLHITNLWCSVVPLQDHSFCSWPWEYFPDISPQWCWTLINHSWFFSPRWLASFVLITDFSSVVLVSCYERLFFSFSWPATIDF